MDHFRSLQGTRDSGPAIPNSRRERERAVSGNEPMSQDGMLSMLDLTVARNKILEAEVKILAKRVSPNLRQ